MSNTRELLSKLRTSLPKIESVVAPAPTTHQFATPVVTSIKAETTRSARAPKLSVSLYQDDIERLESIKEFMKAQGFRNLSDSEALRLACRNVEIDATLIDVYRAMQSQDGRRR